jgi:hypothetical protein
MTITDERQTSDFRRPGRPRPPAPTEPVRRWRMARNLTETGLWLPAAVVAFAMVVRLVDITRAYDINGDEIDYSSLTLSLRSGFFPPVFNGTRFLLHPPFFFGLGSVWADAFRLHGSYIDLLLALRPLNALLAGISAGLLYALGVRMVGRAVGVGAALLFALDPYILRQNGRVMLETSSMALLLAGYLVLVSVMEGRSRHPTRTTVIAGALLGLAILDKDVCAILVVVPLVVMIWWDMGLSRKLILTTLMASLAPYAFFLAALTVGGYLPSFLSQETLGLRRQLGLVQETGFNTAGNPSLFGTAINQLAHFWVTYLISALGILGAAYLVRRTREYTMRLWAVVTLAGAISLAYSVIFGTVEEQMLYFMYIPAILSLMAALVVFARSRFHTYSTANHRFRRVVASAVVLFSVYDLGVWAQIRSAPDNGIQRALTWFQTYAPHPGVIANNTEVTTDLLVRSGFQAMSLTDPQTAARQHVRYLVLLSSTLVGNYGSLNRAQAQFYEHFGQPVFQFHESTYGEVSIYETTDPDVW